MARIRPASETDLPALRAVQAAAVAEPWPAILALAAGDGGPRILVVDDGGVVGYVVAVTAGRPVAYVPELAVEPTRQGEGLGSALLESLLAELVAEGFDRVRLTARAADERVVAFYRARGFEMVDRVDDHFDAGAGVILERRL